MDLDRLDADCEARGRESGELETAAARRAGPWSATSKWIAGTLVLFTVALGAASVHYRLPMWDVPSAMTRVVAAPLLGRIHEADVHEADRLRQGYWVGDARLLRQDALASWRRVEGGTIGFRLLDATGASPLPVDVPFVYETPDAAYLRDLVDTYALREVVGGAANEYDAMLLLGGWVGRLFDHGADTLGGRGRVAPVDVIRAGMNGRRFWCEVAARLTVQTATALGWQARLVTASTSGYTWDHAVAELWSNQYRKWFVIDADFNVVYEVQGVPQSAFELCHYGPAFRQTRRLHVRRIAPPKPSLPLIDLLPYYSYVHIDLRNDWNSRFLRPGSPVGGDRSTWWTARPTLGPVLTAKARVDRQGEFDWPVNAVSIHALGFVHEHDGSRGVRVGLTGYSPTFQKFEVALDSDPWREAPAGEALVPLPAGRHTIRARVVTASGVPGPAYQLGFDIAQTRQ